MLPPSRAGDGLPLLIAAAVMASVAACGGDDDDGDRFKEGAGGNVSTGPGGGLGTGGFTTAPPAPACAAAPSGGSADVAAPELRLSLADSWEEAWLGSPAVADLD